jgi:uncharacterized membrane protein YjdF
MIINKEKIFYIINVMLAYCMTFFVYYRRHHDTIQTQFVILYAALLLIVPFIIWHYIKDWKTSWQMLTLLQIGIMMHYIGGYRLSPTLRIYMTQIHGIGYDKIVHFYNAMAGVIITQNIFKKLKINLQKHELAIIILIILGIGGLIEIIEYTGITTLPKPGEWKYSIPKNQLYDNNLQDIIANLFGGITGATILKIKQHNKKNLT